jgi:cell division septal protein FtsQ
LAQILTEIANVYYEMHKHDQSTIQLYMSNGYVPVEEVSTTDVEPKLSQN